MSSDMQGTVVSIFEIGAFFGAMACVWLGDPLGRRRACFIGAVIMVLGAVLQAAAVSGSMN
jgi:MFS family permease